MLGKGLFSIGNDVLNLGVPKLEGTFNGITKMPQCMPDEYKDKCSVQAYWNYYIGEKHTVANLKTEKLYERRPKTTN